MWQLLWIESLWTQIHKFNSNLQCDGIWRGGLWVVTRSWKQKPQKPTNHGICAQIKETPGSIFFPFTM